jgi:hypothetical protein
MNANARLVVDRWLDGTEAQVTWGDISSGGAAAIVWSGEYFGYPPRIETAPPLLLIGMFQPQRLCECMAKSDGGVHW